MSQRSIPITEDFTNQIIENRTFKSLKTGLKKSDHIELLIFIAIFQMLHVWSICID